MSKLKKNREKLNLTQEELSDKSGISIRTIQRIESGNEPKGQTLKILAKTLGIKENELLEKEEAQIEIKSTLIKIINLTSLPFTIIPPANIIIPLVIMFAKKQFNPLAKQIVSIQILWLIFAVIIFMLSSFMKNWFSLGNKFSLVVMIFLVLSNIFIILRNAAEIDKKGELFFRLNFSLI
ncbi:helix-turn-helix transcriptional regulator [uncultured Algoriphagus sp.]|uniref:helix-turn-helix domain-containing protein n=1 Tax=uncultured Algoriphagus sp. TaxID=417365 RepID=UPI0030EB2EE9|tara:strand:- start:2441 stop:2980 length:540 start_codon:yes stop_codon:yes gene_type:complete